MCPAWRIAHLHQMTDRPNLHLDVDRIQASGRG